MVAELFAATRTAPVDGRIATSAAAGLVLANVFSASFCRVTCRVVVSGLPATGLTSKTVTGSGAALGLGVGVGLGLAELAEFLAGTSWTRTPGVPRSWVSYRFCSPDSPT